VVYDFFQVDLKVLLVGFGEAVLTHLVVTALLKVG
jgi:hypothetical protein